MSKITLALLLLLGLPVAACNTVEGAGRDVSAAGSGIENAAQEAEEELDEEL